MDVETRLCGGCGETKPLTAEHFHKWRNRFKPRCKPCNCAEARAYRAKDPKAHSERSRKWALENAERRREIGREWARRNKDKTKAAYLREKAAGIVYQRSPEARRRASQNYNRKSRQLPGVRLSDRIRTAIGLSLKSAGSSKRERKWEALVGYSRDDLAKHLERQFAKGMTWENMGKWHIDHIIPLSAHQFTDASDPGFRAAWALPNLRPVWAFENLSKNARRTHLL